MLIANNIEHTLDELGSDWEKLNKFVRDCVARLKGADTISIQTLQMQAFFMSDYATFHDCSRKLRAALDDRIDDTADQALFGRAASVTCPPEDPEAALVEIHRVIVGAPQPILQPFGQQHRTRSNGQHYCIWLTWSDGEHRG
jgi:hypothetical protein